MHGLYTEGRGPFANKIIRASMDFRSDGETTVDVQSHPMQSVGDL